MKYLNTDSMRFYSKIIYENRFFKEISIRKKIKFLFIIVIRCFRIRVYANKFNNYYPKIRIVYGE